MITMLAESDRDMQEWMNLLTAVAGTDATPLRFTSVRTITPVLNDAFFSARNSQYETALHALCGVAHVEHTSAVNPTGSNANNALTAAAAKLELEKTLPATAAWLIHRSCPVNTFNLRGQSPLFIAIENGRFHLGLVLLRYGATVPPHCPGKDRFLAFCEDENSQDKIIPALQYLPKPARLRNLHYLSIEILSQYVGTLS
jgi:ankyrin repeat protein